MQVFTFSDIDSFSLSHVQKRFHCSTSPSPKSHQPQFKKLPISIHTTSNNSLPLKSYQPPITDNYSLPLEKRTNPTNTLEHIANLRPQARNVPVDPCITSPPSFSKNPSIQRKERDTPQPKKSPYTRYPLPQQHQKKEARRAENRAVPGRRRRRPLPPPPAPLAPGSGAARLSSEFHLEALSLSLSFEQQQQQQNRPGQLNAPKFLPPPPPWRPMRTFSVFVFIYSTESGGGEGERLTCVPVRWRAYVRVWCSEPDL